MTTKQTTRQNNQSRPASVVNENSALGARESQWQPKVGSTTYRPLLDVYDLGDRYEMHVDLPGTSAESINATVNGGILMVEAQVAQRYQDGSTPLHGEYGIGDFRRQIRLGEDIDTERLEAKYDLGVLTLVLPKHAGRQPHRILVTSG